MDDKLVELYSDEYRKERKLNSELRRAVEDCLIRSNEMNEDLSKFTALAYVRNNLTIDELKMDIKESDIKIDTWDKAREIAINYKGGK